VENMRSRPGIKEKILSFIDFLVGHLEDVGLAGVLLTHRSCYDEVPWANDVSTFKRLYPTVVAMFQTTVLAFNKATPWVILLHVWVITKLEPLSRLNDNRLLPVFCHKLFKERPLVALQFDILWGYQGHVARILCDRIAHSVL